MLTTGPAVGGQSFVAWVKSAFGLTAPGWQVLCGAAALCSLVATVATQLLKSNNLEERVFRGQSCRAKLEALDVGLSTGQIDVPRATTAYMQCLEEAAFLESRYFRFQLPASSFPPLMRSLVRATGPDPS